MDATAEARFDLTGDGLAEILNPKLLKSSLAGGRNPRVYWGLPTA